MLRDALVRAHETPGEMAPFSVQFPGITAADGYAAAHALHQHRLALGWRPLGRKIGFTNRTLWARYGVYEPIWGTVYDRTLIEARQGQARVSLDGLVNPRIEPEICFGLRAAPRADAPLEAIEWMAHAIEIVQCRHPGWKVTLPDCTTDNGLHGRLVLGERVPLPADAAERLPLTRVELFRGEERIDSGVGANVLGSPLAALAHLVEVLARQPEAPPLRAGEIVSTGVITDAHPVAAGETWSTRISGLPLAGLRVDFA